MISFDDYGGGDGSNVNLSPIYNSLSTINEYISTLSNNVVNNSYYYTTLSYDSIVNSGTIMSISRPYLQDFTPSDGTYQYNISGDVDVSNLSFSTDFNILGAISNVSGTLTVNDTIDLKIDKFENFSKVSFDDTIQYLKLTGKNIINNTISSINKGVIDVSLISNQSLNANILNINALEITSNTFNCAGIASLNAVSIGENTLSYNDYYLNANEIKYNKYSGLGFHASGSLFMNNTISNCRFLQLNNLYNNNNYISTGSNILGYGDGFNTNTIKYAINLNLDYLSISKNNILSGYYMFLSAYRCNENTIKFNQHLKFNGGNFNSNSINSAYIHDVQCYDYENNTETGGEYYNLKAYSVKNNDIKNQSIMDIAGALVSSNTISGGDRFSFKGMSISKNTINNLLNVNIDGVAIKSNSIAGRTHSSQVLFAEFKNALDFESNTLSLVKFQSLHNYHLWGNIIDDFEYARHLAMTYHGNLIKNGNYLEATASLFWDGNTLSNIQTFHGHAGIIEASYENIRSFNVDGSEIRNITLSSCEDAKLNFYNYNSNISLNDISNLYLNQYKTQSDIYYNNISRYIVGFAGTSNYLFDSNWNYTLDSSALDTNKLYLSEVPYALLTKGGSGGGSPYMKSYNSTDGVYQYNITGTYDIWNLRQLQTLTLNGHLNITHNNLDTLTFKYFNVDLEGYNSGWWLESMKQMKINNGDNFVFNTLRNGDFVNVYGGIQSKNSFSGIHYLNQAVSSNKQNTYLENRIYKCCIPFEFIKNSISKNSINDITLVSPYTISSDWNSGNTFEHNGLNHIVAGGLYKNTFSDNQFDDIDVMTLNGNEFNDDDYISLKAYSMNGNAFTLIEGFNHLEGIFAQSNTFKYGEMCDIKYYSMNANSYDSCYNMSISAVIDESNTYSNITKLNLNGYMLNEPVFSDISTLKLTAASLNGGTIRNIDRFHVNKSELINNFVYTYGVSSMYLEYPDGIFDSYGKIETSNTLTSIMYLDNVPLTYLKQLENGGGGVFNYMKPYYSSDGNYQYNLSGKPTTTFELSDNIKYDLWGNWSINGCSFTSFNNNINISCHEFNSNSGDSFDGLTINSPFITENQISQINSLNVKGIFSSNLMTTINYFDYDGPLLQKNTFQASMFDAKNCNVKDNILGCSNMYLKHVSLSNNNFNGYKEMIIDANLIMKNSLMGEYIPNSFNNGYLSIRCNDDIKTNQIAQWNLADINIEKYKLSDCRIFGNDTVNISAGGIINSGMTTYSGIKELNISASGTISNAIFENIDKLCISAGALSNCTFRSLNTCDLFEVSGINTNNCDFSSIKSLKYPLLHSDSISIDMYNGTQGTLAGDSIISIDFKNVDYSLVDWIKRSTYTYFNESNYFYGAASDCYWNGVNMMVFK